MNEKSQYNFDINNELIFQFYLVDMNFWLCHCDNANNYKSEYLLPALTDKDFNAIFPVTIDTKSIIHTGLPNQIQEYIINNKENLYKK